MNEKMESTKGHGSLFHATNDYGPGSLNFRKVPFNSELEKQGNSRKSWKKHTFRFGKKVTHESDPKKVI